jgi:hypothetical protein
MEGPWFFLLTCSGKWVDGALTKCAWGWCMIAGWTCLTLENCKAIWLFIDPIYCNSFCGISGKAINNHFSFTDYQKQQPEIFIPWKLGAITILTMKPILSILFLPSTTKVLPQTHQIIILFHQTRENKGSLIFLQLGALVKFRCLCFVADLLNQIKRKGPQMLLRRLWRSAGFESH